MILKFKPRSLHENKINRELYIQESPKFTFYVDRTLYFNLVKNNANHLFRKSLRHNTAGVLKDIPISRYLLFTLLTAAIYV